MKNVILIVAMLATSVTTFAQVDLKLNPLSLLFGRIGLEGEYVVNDNFGVELGGFINSESETIEDEEFKSTGAGALLAGKYYFNPEDGADNFFTGLYTRIKSNSFKSSIDNSSFSRGKVAVGLLVGKKWVSDKNLVFEAAVGAGRNISTSSSADDQDLLLLVDALNSFPVDFLVRFSIGYRFGG